MLSKERRRERWRNTRRGRERERLRERKEKKRTGSTIATMAFLRVCGVMSIGKCNLFGEAHTHTQFTIALLAAGCLVNSRITFGRRTLILCSWRVKPSR